LLTGCSFGHTLDWPLNVLSQLAEQQGYSDANAGLFRGGTEHLQTPLKIAAGPHLAAGQHQVRLKSIQVPT
jgi:hypothetical protein